MTNLKTATAVMNTENTVVLETYAYDKEGNGLDGESATVVFDKDWLEKEIAPQTLEEFLSEYTYDDSEYLLNKC